MHLKPILARLEARLDACIGCKLTVLVPASDQIRFSLIMIRH